MSCDELQAVSGLYASGDIDPADRAAMATHLADCPRCTGELAAMRQAAARIQADLADWVHAEPMPADFAYRLEAVVRAETRTRALRASRTRTLAMAVAALAAALALVVLVPRQSASGQPMLSSLTSLFRGAPATHAGQPVLVPADGKSLVAGVTLAAGTVAFSDAQTVVNYRLEGLPAEMTAASQSGDLSAAELLAATGSIALRGVTVVVDRAAHRAAVTATYAPAPRGTALQLRIQQLRLSSGGHPTTGPWQVALPARP